MMKKVRGNIPALTGVRYDRDCFLIVPRNHATYGRSSFRLKEDTIANAEIQHPRMRSRLGQKPQALDDSIIEIDKLCFRKIVDVDLHLIPPIPHTRSRAGPVLWLIAEPAPQRLHTLIKIVRIYLHHGIATPELSGSLNFVGPLEPLVGPWSLAQLRHAVGDPVHRLL